MRARLRTALADALADDAVRVVVLDHTGRVFSLLELSARFFAGKEGQEGIAAFREKGPAHWVPAAD